MLDQIIKNLAEKMEEIVGRFRDEIQKIRTSRASSVLVEDLKVDSYGSLVALKTVASISAPQANLIQITPWDKNLMKSIETALSGADLGGAPVSDGATIRVVIPPMTGERREELVKKLHSLTEEVKVALRQAREDSWREIQGAEKSKGLTEDDRFRGKDELDKLIRQFYAKLDEIEKSKISELSE